MQTVALSIWFVGLIFISVSHVSTVSATCGYDSCQDTPLYQCSLDYCTTSTAFALSDKQLTGTIPSSPWQLSNLAVLSLANNSLTGSIASTIGSLKAVKEIYLEWNSLTGSIPESVGSLAGVTNLNLLGNNLSGEIPEGVGNLINLKSLDLSQNKLGGTLHESFCNLYEAGANVELNNVRCETEYAINYVVQSPIM